MSNETSNSPTNGPTRWMLEGDAPEPQTSTPAKALTAAQAKRLDTGATPTGTDPLGRAIGPAEDHTQIKKVRDADGKIVTPRAPSNRPRS